MSNYEFWKELGKIFNAVVSYQEKSIEFNKRFINPWIRIGNVFDQQDRQREEVRAYEQAVELDPDHAQNWIDLGTAHYRNQSYDEAVSAFEKAIELDPGLGWPYSNLALIQAERNNYTEAKELYEKSIELLKDNRDKAISWNRLGNLHRKLNEYDLAIRAFQTADELDGENAGFKDVLSETVVKPEQQADDPAQSDPIATSIHLIIEQSQFEDAAMQEFRVIEPEMETEEPKQPEAAALAKADSNSNIEELGLSDAGECEPVVENAGQIEDAQKSCSEVDARIVPISDEPITSEAAAATEAACAGDVLPNQTAETEAINTNTVLAAVENISSAPSEPATEAVESASGNSVEPVAEFFEAEKQVEPVDVIAEKEPDEETAETQNPIEVVGEEAEPVAVPVAELVEALHSAELAADEIEPIATAIESAADGIEPVAAISQDPPAEIAEAANSVDAVVDLAEPAAATAAEESVSKPAELSNPIAEEFESAATAVEEGPVAEIPEASTEAVAEALPARIEQDSPAISEAVAEDASVPMEVEEANMAQHSAYEAFLKDEEQALTSIPVYVSPDTQGQDIAASQPKPLAIVDESGEFQLEMNPKNAHVWNELGNVYFNRGAVDDAIIAYSKAIEMDREFAWPYSNLALAYVQKGRFAESMLLYQRSIELFTDDKDKAISWNRLGNVYRRLNDYDNAIAAYQRADELDPDNSVIYLQSRFSLLGSFQTSQDAKVNS